MNESYDFQKARVAEKELNDRARAVLETWGVDLNPNSARADLSKSRPQPEVVSTSMSGFTVREGNGEKTTRYADGKVVKGTDLGLASKRGTGQPNVWVSPDRYIK